MVDEARTTRAAIPKLSKPRFMSGLQCQKRLYLECHARELLSTVDPFTPALFDIGTAGARSGA